MKLTNEELGLVIDAISYAVRKIVPPFENDDLRKSYIERKIADAIEGFLNDRDLFLPDLYDDVDETNYDPFTGQDEYECDSIEEEW